MKWKIFSDAFAPNDVRRIRPDLDDHLLAQIDPQGLAEHPSWTWGYQHEDVHKLLFCGGFLPIADGVVETWAVVSATLPVLKVRLPLIQLIASFHLDYAKHFDIRRAQCMVDSDYTHAHTLVRWLGYKHEGRMEEWGRNGEVKHRYAWLLRDHI